MTWETVIGLETHVELATKTKIFCSCTTQFGGAPNTHCCPVCTGMPGTLPVLNEKVLEFAVKAGLALNCQISRTSRFDRKNYFYPDLPKAYQISQLYLPICHDGKVDIGEGKTIRIHELHMEEDAGKLVHDPWLDQTRADYNRCGVPLIEIVTEPDFRSAEEVIAYLEKLRSTLQYLGVSDCKMQEGSLRCDVNLSVRPAGSAEFGTRTEMKNLNSFKAISRAIAYEARRQIELIEEGKRVVQETRRHLRHALQGERPGLPLLPRAGHSAAGAVGGVYRGAAGGPARIGGGQAGALSGRLGPARLRHGDDHLPEGPGRLL